MSCYSYLRSVLICLAVVFVLLSLPQLLAVEAAKQFRLDWVCTLIRLGADVDLRVRLETANPNKKGLYTPLMIAVNVQADDAVEKLLLLGANPNATRSDGITPLMDAASDCNEPIVRRLLRAGASLSQKDALGRTALTHVLESEPIDTARVQAKSRVISALLESRPGQGATEPSRRSQRRPVRPSGLVSGSRGERAKADCLR